jgi:molybdopterin/thiamine biosynthesis adenylyltransferase
LKLDYSRQAGAADLDVLRASRVVIVGVGSASELAIKLARMGVGRLTFIDPDVVERKNVASQGYTYADALARTPKVEALRRDCAAINPDVAVAALQEDFCRLPDERLKGLLAEADLLLMTTDHHPAQARGALAGLVCAVPVVLGALYRRGRAGEIVFTYPGETRACYRCITRGRYEHVARNRTGGTGDAAGSLPFAAGVIDNILGHLAVGILHRRRGAGNAYARWIDRLGQRNFIQTRMDPDYRLGDEDIFGDVFGRGEKLFAFDTIWQRGEPHPGCPDCGGRGARPGADRRSESTALDERDCGCLVQHGFPARRCPACGAAG